MAGEDPGTYAAQRAVTVRLTPEVTSAPLRTLPDTYRTRANDVLLSALGRALRAGTGQDRVVVDVEGHGREELFPSWTSAARSAGSPPGTWSRSPSRRTPAGTPY